MEAVEDALVVVGLVRLGLPRRRRGDELIHCNRRRRRSESKIDQKSKKMKQRSFLFLRKGKKERPFPQSLLVVRDFEGGERVNLFIYLYIWALILKQENKKTKEFRILN